MTSRHRLRAVIAALALASAGFVTVIAAGPASAAPTAPAPVSSTLVPLNLAPASTTASSHKPDIAAARTAAATSNCSTVRANLRQYAARHIRQVTCFTVNPKSTTAAAATTTSATAKDAAASSWCTQSSGGDWVYDRTESCTDGTITSTIYDENGVILGSSIFDAQQDILLQPTNTTFVENDTFTFVSGTLMGAEPGTLEFAVGCNSPCTLLTSHTYTAPLFIGGSTSANFTYEDTPGTQTPDTFLSNYAFDFVQPGTFTTQIATWSSAPTIRCDNLLGGQPAGCVYPDYAPYLELSAATYGAGAVNVAVGEDLIPGSPGASTPLTRGDPGFTNSNRAFICDSTFIYSSLVPSDSCDEYPFASSQQSGGALGLTGSSCVETMPIELNGVWYYELFNPYVSQPCERGHVPLSENQDIGAPLISMINTNRVLIDDAYWVQVTN